MLMCLFCLTCHHVMTYCVERWRLIRSPSTGDRTIGGHGPESQVRRFLSRRALTQQCCPGRFLRWAAKAVSAAQLCGPALTNSHPCSTLQGKLIRKDGAPADSAQAAGSSTKKTACIPDCACGLMKITTAAVSQKNSTVCQNWVSTHL